MVRERDELCITVPSLFRCPISLDVMRSPVSLCTGVTYERSSIQYWLESGHDTCPATMQILSTKEFVPNLTLHRLISTWSRPLTLSEREVRVLIEKVGCESESKTTVVDCLLKIAEVVSSREENRRFLARYGGFVDTVVDILRRNSVEIVVLESVVRVLDLILTENGVKEKLNSLIMKSNNNCLSSILKVIHKGSLDSKIRSIKILDSISVDNESKRQLSETENLLSVLFDNLKTAEDENLDDAVLMILITLSEIRPVKTQLVKLGLVQVLSNNTLWNPKSANPNVGKAIKLLSLMVTCSEGRCAVSEEPRCAAGIVERIMKVKKTAREDGMVVLWSMCCLYKDGKVKEAVVRSNGVTKMLLVMQSENEGIVRRMCGDLIKVLGKNNSGLGVYDSKTTHIMPY